MFNRRHQDQWRIRANNANLLVNATQMDVQNVYSFCEHYNDFLSQFVFSTLQMHMTIRITKHAVIVDTQDNLVRVIQILKEQRFIFIDLINQTRASYKGYISWLIIATQNQLYLIDVAKLHDKCHELKAVLSKKSIIKFMHQCQEVLFALKRDFGIFMPNVFDLEVIQRHMIKERKTSIHPKVNFRNFINSLSPFSIGMRPIKQSLSSQVLQYYEGQMSFLLNLDNFFTRQDSQYQCYAYFNHYELLLKSYFHHKPSVRQIDQLLKMNHEMTYNRSRQYDHHQQMNLMRQIQGQNNYWVKDQQQQEISQLLCQWRQHMAKIRDINAEQVLPYETLSNLAMTKINSILQISQLCSNLGSYQQRIYCLSLEQFQQIFQLLQLYKQQKQEDSHQLIIPRRLPYYKINEQKPIKQLFEQLKFSDVSNDWLNKKTDQSVSLYKQIVSMNEFDSGIIEEYMKQISCSDGGIQHLKIQDINRYIKYAEYLRNGNHKKLQELYEKSKDKNEDQFFEQDFIQGQCSGESWGEIEDQLSFPTMDSITQVKSTGNLTSIESFSNLQFINIKSRGMSYQNQLHSLNQPQCSSSFQRIQPLPQGIQQIYLQAAKAKRDYGSKGQKKNSKAKKQARTKTQNPKKEEQFVPIKQEIFNLIHY